MDPAAPPPRAFRAVEIDPRSGQPTGAARLLAASSRHEAIARLLDDLGVAADQATVGPNGVVVRVGARAWTIVAPPPGGRPTESPHLRRAGAKHRHTP